MTKLLLPVWLLAFLLPAAAQSYVPSPTPKQHFVDNAGNPCAGCSLYSYLAGTTTPTPTYVDYTSGTQNQNPIILDTAGNAVIGLNPSITYKFALIENGATQWTIDQVPGLPGNSSSLQLLGGTMTGAIAFSGGPSGMPATTTLANLGGLSSILTSLQSFAGPVNISTLNGLPAQEYKTTSANPSQLENFWRYLHATPVYSGNYPAAGMDIILPNDSLWEGDVTNSQGTPLGCGPNTAVPQYSQNRQAEQLRIAWQSQYGYGGTGIQPVINVMGCNLVNPELYTASPTTITTTTEIGPQYLTNGSVITMSSGQVITWNGGGLPYTFARIYCADDSASNSMAIAIDTVSVGTACGTHNSTPIARVFTTTPNQTYTNHSLTVTCATSPCLLYGIEGRPSTGSGNAGIRVHNTSVGSAPSGWFAGHTDFEDLITDGILTPSAQLVIYAMGTNDAALSIGVPIYTANFEAYFAHELAKTGETPVIVVYRPGLDSIASQSYFAALTAYGYANNMIVVDQTNRWGTNCTTGCWWLGNDNIHMNDGANLDSSHTILNALTDVMHGQHITPLAGDTGLNAGVYRVTSPAFSGFIGTPGYAWDGVPGIPSMKGIYGWQTGNSINLPGVIGLFDPNFAGLVWMTNVNNDFCLHVPTSGANFTTCAGKNFRVVKSTGEVDTHNNTLDDGSGNQAIAGNSAVTGLVSGTAGLKAGASGSTIADTRSLVQSVTFCGLSATCASPTTLASPHMVGGTATLSGGTVTISGIPAFTSTSTYSCTGTDTTAANSVKFAAISTTSFSLTGTSTDVIAYTCLGY